jgi:hypothetical protein
VVCGRVILHGSPVVKIECDQIRNVGAGVQVDDVEKVVGADDAPVVARVIIAHKSEKGFVANPVAQALDETRAIKVDGVDVTAEAGGVVQPRIDPAAWGMRVDPKRPPPADQVG